MGYAFDPADASEFVLDFGWLPLVGDPTRTVGSYVATHTPAWGVVADAGNRNILVWYDAAGKLHVIDITDEPSQVASISKPAYHTADESFLYNLAQRTADVAAQVGPTIDAGVSVMLDVLKRTAQKIPNLVPSGNVLFGVALVLGAMYLFGSPARRSA